MNQRERSQVELIVARELSYTQSGLDAGTEAIYSQNSAQGRLRSGATIRMTVRHLKEAVEDHLRRLIEEVRPVSGDDEAFAIISRSMAGCIQAATAKMPRLIEVSGVGSDSPAARAGYEHWAIAQADIQGKLKIAEYGFGAVDKPSKAILGAAAMNKGGATSISFLGRDVGGHRSQPVQRRSET
ncbi:MAG: hypothetical protein ACJ8DU_10590 [Microvirga sp.]|jgi:hypothetical protein